MGREKCGLTPLRDEQRHMTPTHRLAARLSDDGGETPLASNGTVACRRFCRREPIDGLYTPQLRLVPVNEVEQ